MTDKINKLKAQVNEVKYLAEEAVMLYNDNSPLRLCILGIPSLGPVIDTILTSKGQSISYDRLLKFYNELSTQINSIEEKLIDLDFVNSEEFYDLLIKISEISIKTRNDEKRQLFAKILSQKCIGVELDTSPEFFINVLAELSNEELIVAKKLYELKETNEYESIVKENQKEGSSLKTSQVLEHCNLPINNEDLDFILLRLERIGLIKELNGMFLGYTGGSYLLTETFRKLMKAIDEDHKE